jgi:phage-related protein
MKAIIFHGSSLDDIKNFPDDIKRAAGDQLRFVQMGLETADWKPMRSIVRG